MTLIEEFNPYFGFSGNNEYQTFDLCFRHYLAIEEKIQELVLSIFQRSNGELIPLQFPMAQITQAYESFWATRGCTIAIQRR